VRGKSGAICPGALPGRAAVVSIELRK